MTSQRAGSPTTPPRAIDARRERHHRERGASWPFGRRLLGQVGIALADLPLFLTAPLYGRWRLQWGSTNDEVASAMPGDAMSPNAQFVSTRSNTINAEPAAVWPWLVQVSCGRAGSTATTSSTTSLARARQRLRPTCSISRSASGFGSPLRRPRLTRRRCGWTPSRSIGGCCGRSRTAPGRCGDSDGDRCDPDRRCRLNGTSPAAPGSRSGQ